MKRILVPCDFSAPSREAFKLAMNIASKLNGEVSVLHVIYIPVLYDPTLAGASTFAYDPVFLSAMEDEAKKRFEQMQNAFPSSTVKTSIQVIQGTLVSAIKGILESGKIDLVIMGTTGASGLQKIFIGSNTEKVIRHSSVPVLAVRTAPDISSIRKILLPTKLSLDQTQFMSKVKELLHFFDASLHVLLINTPLNFKSDAEAKASLEKFADHYKLQDYELYFRNYHSEEEGILKFAHDEKIDLIAMATHGWKGLLHLLNGSITEDVVNHIRCPVWTYCVNK